MKNLRLRNLADDTIIKISTEIPVDLSFTYPDGADVQAVVFDEGEFVSVTIPTPVITITTAPSIAYSAEGAFVITPGSGYSPSDVTLTYEAFQDGVSIGPVSLGFGAPDLGVIEGDWYVIEKAEKVGRVPLFTNSNTVSVIAETPYPYMTADQWFGGEAVLDVDTRKTSVSTVLAPPAGKVWAAHRNSTTYGATLPSGVTGDLVVMAWDGARYAWTSAGTYSAGATGYCRIGIGNASDVVGSVLTVADWAVDEKSFTVSNTPLALGAGDWTATTADNGYTVDIDVASDWRGRQGTEYRLVVGGVDVGPLSGGTALGPRFVSELTGAAQPVAIKSVNANGTATSATKSVTATIVVPVSGDAFIDLGSQQWNFSNVVSLVQHVDGVVAVVVEPGQSAVWQSKVPAMTGTGLTMRNGQAVQPLRSGCGYLDGRMVGNSTAITTLPATIPAGQTAISADSQLTGVATSKRDGPCRNIHGFYVTEVSPNPLTLGPGMSATTLSVPSAVDYLAVAATLPTTWSHSGYAYHNKETISFNMRFNPAFGMNNRTLNPGGYEECAPYRWGDISNTQVNYGQFTSEKLDPYICYLGASLADVPLATKAEILMRFDSYGWQTQQNLQTRTLGADGAHFFIEMFAIFLHHHLRGNAAGMDAAFSSYGGGAKQAFQWTQAHLDNWTIPHGTAGSQSGLYTVVDGLHRPAFAIRRFVTAANAGTKVVTIPGYVQVGGGGLYGDSLKARYGTSGGGGLPQLGMTLVNETTGESATVISSGGDHNKGEPFNLTVNVWPALGFSVNDVVYMSIPWTPYLGLYDFRLGGGLKPNFYEPGQYTAYRNQQTWGRWMVGARILGLHRPNWQTSWGYALETMTTAPGFTDANWPPIINGGLAKNLWDTRQADILAVPQPYLT